MSAILSIFWGLVLFSALVFIHEGGHYLAARMFGVRVLEFFIGMPSKLQLSFVSRKKGTRFGVTPLLLGGYARIAGMDLGKKLDHLASLFTLIQIKGVASLQELAGLLKISVDSCSDHLLALENWGSIKFVPFEEYERLCIELADKKGISLPDLSSSFEGVERAFQYVALNMPRDEEGKTQFDKANLAQLDNSYLGASFRPKDMSYEEFFKQEKRRCYAGISALPRIIILLAGIFVNIVFALALFVALFMGHGLDMPNQTISAVQEQSKAAQIGLEPGDTIQAIDGKTINSWSELQMALANHKNGRDFVLSVLKANNKTLQDYQIKLEAQENLGVFPTVERHKLNFKDSLSMSLGYTLQTAQAVARLFSPSGFSETISQSGSVVAISVMAKDAAQSGILPFASLAAAISLSLGFMNLLPIPPLDGGKVVIELVQALTRRPVSEKIQVALSIAGVAFILMLFIYLTGQDIFRIISG